jgi:hypothetical protein
VKRRFLIIPLVAAAITLALYGRSLPLPFYSDDLVQIPWLRQVSWADLWTRVTPYGYYRPLAFALWKSLPTSPIVLRSLNLLLHTLAATLVGCLAIFLPPPCKGEGAPNISHQKSLGGWERWWPGVAAAAFFAAYPFAYQVVPWVSAVFYPLVVVLSVFAVIAYQRARAGGHPGWWAASFAATTLAPLAHENGLLTGLLVALCELFIQERPRRWIWPLIYLAVGALSGAVWWAVRPAGLSTLALDPAGLAQNATFLVQGLSFPLAPLAWLFDGAAWAIWAIALPTVALLVWAAGRRGAYALAWFALSILPAWVMMRPDWLVDAPRFLYPAGVGAALLWGFALARLTSTGREQDKGLKPLAPAGAECEGSGRSPQERFPSPPLFTGEGAPEARVGVNLRSISYLFTKPILGSILALAALAPGAIFAWEGVTWHLRGGEPIREAIEAAQESPEAPFLLVNLPDRLAPAQSLYPRNHGGAILLPPQVPTGDIIGAPLGEPRPQDAAITAGWLLAPVDYARTTYGPTPESPEALAALIAEGRGVYVTEYTGTDAHLREAGQVLSEPPSGPPLATFGENLELVSASTQVEGDVLRLALVWLVETPPVTDETVFVHVVDAEENLVAQADGDPLMGLYPMTLWPPGAAVLDVRYARLAEDAPAEVYVGVWQPGTGERLQAFAHDGARFPDDRVPVYNPP